jgi:hypothetical protein
MDTSVITALAAAGGSIVGAAASVVITWINQQKQTARELTQARHRERETLYGEFITEASRVTVDAVSHSLDSLEKLVKLYGILGRIRLVSDEHVLVEAEKCCRRIVDLYARPNISVEQMGDTFDPEKIDPLKPFSSACRGELSRIRLLGPRWPLHWPHRLHRTEGILLTA